MTNAPDSNDNPLPIVGIGASAGGLVAFEELFGHLSDDIGLVYVVVQHLSPHQKSSLHTILERYSSMPVVVLDEPTRVEPDHIYVLPPAASLTLEGNYLRPDVSETERRQHKPIDHFFESLAVNRREHAIGIILSGTRDDGSRGLVAIKDRGGTTFVQSPEEADYDAMPRNAVDTGRVDLVLPAAELAGRLTEYIAADRTSVAGAADIGGDRFEQAYRQIVARLRSVTGHDFTHYKRSTMLRRIERRVRLHKLSGLVEYCQLLSDNPDEVHALFDEILITVTEFFRDTDAFEALRRKVVGGLFDNKQDGEPIRVWIPGCSSGEEVYSIAILLWEEANRRDVFPDFKLFATDLDERAVELARQATYSRSEVAKLGRRRRERFFTVEAGGYRIVSELRERVLFAVHDILQEPPFARQDLISCRNLLIYMDAEAQRQVFDIIHYSLRPTGRLFLGASEFIGEARDLFSPVDKKQRIFRPKSTDQHILPVSDVVSTANRNRAQPPDQAKTEPMDDASFVRLEHEHHLVLNHQYAPPSVLVDSDYEIVHVAGDAKNFLRVPRGEPTDDVLEAIPTALRLELRSGLIDVFEHHQRITTDHVTFEQDGDTISVRLVIQPLESARLDDSELAQIVFETGDETSRREPIETVEATDIGESVEKIVAQLEAENRRLKNELRATIERYETTTEELKTSNEELLTINEELQSTTEELETSKEELESTNEELTTVNDELSHKMGELDEVNSDLKNLLSSTEIGTIFLDRSLIIKRFTTPVRDYFNIVDTDVGRPIKHITHDLQYDGLIDDIHCVLKELEPTEREIPSRNHQRWFIARINPYRTVDDRIAGTVLTFFDITDRKEAQQRLADNELLFRTIFESASDAMFLFELDESNQPSTFSQVNENACERVGYPKRRLEKMTLFDIVDSASTDLEAHFQNLREHRQAIDEVRLEDRSGELTTDELNSRLFSIAERETVITISRDISRHKTYEKMLVEAKEESERLADLRAAFLANMSHEIRTPLTSIIGVSQLLGQRELPDQQRQMVELLQISGRRLQQTLDSVLDISRLEAGEMKPDYEKCDVVDEIRDDVEILRPQAEEKGLDLRFMAAPADRQFCTDPGFVSRIVYNLVHNAIKFTQEGSVQVRVEWLDDAIELIVSDTGIGIGQDFLPHLFDKFKQASSGTGRKFEGSGLGMSLIQNLLDLMDGTIDVESQKGKGTTFTVTIPEHRDDDAS